MGRDLFAVLSHHHEGLAPKVSTMHKHLSIDKARTTFVVGVMSI